LAYTVLMSIYHDSSSEDLNRCLASLEQQTRQADEIVIVEDGPVNDDVTHCLRSYSPTLPIRTIALQNNIGLGGALRVGLLQCKNNIVARVDSDDWSAKQRMELQEDFLANNPSISVVAAQMREWHSTRSGPISAVRSVPLTSDKIVRLSRWKNPINHPTVMFRKRDVLECGNYYDQSYFEDYHLWARMIKQQKLFVNLSQILVDTVVDDDYFRRRGGFRYVLNEISLARSLHKFDFFSTARMLIFILGRLPTRLMPTVYRRIIYKALLRKKK